jgi:hypothetical protein
MRRLWILALAFSLASATTAMAFETRAYQLNEDFGTEPIYDIALQYYYYVPCPTYSWFWGFSGWNTGDMVGEWFQIGDEGTGPFSPCDPALCRDLEMIRVLDFAGYGVVYPGLFTIELDVYCCDEYGCPVGPPIWNSGPKETDLGWNYFEFDPLLDVDDCAGGPVSGARVLITATHTGSEGIYPAWGTDNVGTAVETGCMLHDLGCLPALHPRPYISQYASIHSGYYGQDFEYCPPRWFKDGRDSTSEGTQFGFAELCWRLYLGFRWGGANQPATWGSIKSMYR